MKWFFTNVPSSVPMTLFGPLHLVILGVTLGSIILVYLNKDKLKNFKYKNKVPYIVSGILFFNMVIYYGGYLINGYYDWKVHLPLHFCFIIGYIFIFSVVTKKKNWFNYLYYAIFGCTVMSIIFMLGICSYDRYVFYQFLISHNLMLISSFYMLYVLDYKVDKSGLKKAIVINNIIFIVVLIFNVIFGTNYIFFNNFPEHITEIIPFLKHSIGILNIVILELLNIALSFIAYLFIRKSN